MGRCDPQNRLGELAFLDRIEHLLGRPVRPAKRGPKQKEQEN
jgi:hypothetical protein